MDQELISREEVVGLLSRVNDIAEALLRIERFLENENGEEEDHEG